jgi:hypothetical protein
MGEEIENVKGAFASAIKTTTAKLILNFGKTVPPVFEKWAKMAKTMKVNKDCDTECASTCLDPTVKQHYPFYIDTDCLH